MQAIFDFQDVLKYLFLKHQCYSTIKINKIRQQEVHVNSLLLAQTRLNSDQSKDNQLLLKFQQFSLKNNKVFFYFPANFQAQKKDDFESVYKCLEGEIKFQIINDLKTKFFEQNQNKISDFNKIFQSNSFLQKNHFYLQQKEYMKQIAEQGYTQFRVPQNVSSQLLYTHFKDKNCVVFDSPLNFCFSQNLTKIGYEIQSNKIYFYDVHKFIKRFRLEKYVSRDILFWCMIIYAYRKEQQNNPLIFRTTLQPSDNYFIRYVSLLNKDIQMIERLIQKLKQVPNLPINYANWLVIKDTFNLKKNNDFKDYNFFIEQLAYDQDIQTAVYFNIQNYKITQYKQAKIYRQNIFLNDNIWKLNFHNLIPLDFTHFIKFQKNQVFFLTNYFVNASYEYQYFQCNLDEAYSQQSFENIGNLLIKQTPKLIIMKQFFVNKKLILQNKKTTKNLYIFNDEIRPDLFNVMKAIKYNRLSLMKNNIEDIQKSINQIQLNILLQFLDVINIFDLKNFQKSEEFEILYKFGQNNMIEEGILILQFMKHDLFNKSSFLSKTNKIFLKPEVGKNRILEIQKIKNFTKQDFKEYINDIIGYQNVDLFYPLIQYLQLQDKTKTKKFVWGLWKIYSKNISQSKFLMQENFFFIMLKILTQLLNKSKEPSYQIWKRMQDVFEKNYQNIIFVSLIASLIQKEFKSSYQNDLRSYRIDSFIRFLNDKIFNVIQSCQCNVLVNQLDVEPSLYLRNFFKNLQFTIYKFNSYGCIIKEILLLTLLLPIIRKYHSFYEDTLKNKIYNLLIQVQTITTNIFKTIFQITKVLIDLQQIDSINKKYSLFFKKVKSIQSFMDYIKQSFKEIDITI